MKKVVPFAMSVLLLLAAVSCGQHMTTDEWIRKWQQVAAVLR